MICTEYLSLSYNNTVKNYMSNHKLGTIGIKEISICKCIALCARKRRVTLNLEKFLSRRICLPIYLLRKKKKDFLEENFKICKRVCFIGEVKDEKISLSQTVNRVKC